MMNGMREPSPELVAYFVNIDYEAHMALVALTGEGPLERFIGIARYILDADAECEFAIAVMDAWQSRGVGTTLTAMLMDYARARGMRRFYCHILAGNHRMTEFARGLGMTMGRHPKDATLIRAVRDL